MPIVYVISNQKKRETKIGFTDDLAKVISALNEKSKGWVLTNKESYTSKKNALIRVKQLKNKQK